MKILAVFLGVILLAFGQGQIAQADSLTMLIGDKDYLGGNATTNHFTHGPWDTRSAAEVAATNGAQHTDYAAAYWGTYFYSVDFMFDYDAFASIDSVNLTIGAGGIQSNDTDPNTSYFVEDGLLIDSVLVPDAFNGVDQSYDIARGFGILNWSIDNSFFSYFMDGSATVTVALNSYAGTDLPNIGGEPAVFDFAELTVNGQLQNGGAQPVPEPATMLLLGSGLIGLAGFGRKFRKK